MKRDLPGLLDSFFACALRQHALGSWGSWIRTRTGLGLAGEELGLGGGGWEGQSAWNLDW